MRVAVFAVGLLLTPTLCAQVEILESSAPKRQRIESPGRMRVPLAAPRIQSGSGDGTTMLGWSTKEFRHVIVDTVSLASAVVELRLGRRGGSFSVTIETAMEPGHDQDVMVTVAFYDGEERIAGASSHWWNHDEGKTEETTIRGRHERPREYWLDLSRRQGLSLQVEIEVKPQGR